MRKFYVISFIITTILWLSCANDSFIQEVLECNQVVTYETLLPVIETNCSYSGCHDGITQPDYNAYDGIQPDFGEMMSRVIDRKDMPPSYAEGPKEMTPEELNMFNCWIEQGFPEN